MKAGIIAPISLLDYYSGFTNYHVCNPKLLIESQDYLNFYLGRKALGNFLIVDCSITEPREPINSTDLITALTLLKPNLVVLPNSDMNTERTLSLTSGFLNLYKRSLDQLDVGFIGMVQGATMKQCIFCSKVLSKMVDSLGLPRSMESSVDRTKFLKEVQIDLPIHIFGIHSSPEVEIDNLLSLEMDNIVGISSDLPVRLGFLCRLLDEYRPEPPPLNWFTTHNPFPDFTKKNVEEFIYLAEGEY